VNLREFSENDTHTRHGKDKGMSIRYDSEVLPDIKVIGVGGGGCNAVNRMTRAKIPGVTFVSCNTDAQALMSSEAQHRIRIGEKLTKGLGVGGDPTRGERAADESRDEVLELLRNTEMVFICAGMGGGTGTGAAPVIAEIAKECNALTIGIVTMPFAWEGQKRRRQAEEGVARLREKVDTLIVIPNQRLMEICAPNCSVEEAFATADDVLHQAIRSISNIISSNGSINLDFNDIKTVMSEAGPALLAVGKASGENRAVEAARAATMSALLDQSIDGARALLWSISYSGDLGIRELDAAGRVIAELADPEANIFMGTVVDPTMEDDVQVTLIATGFPPKGRRQEDPRNEIHRIGDMGLPGVSSMDDAELPAFLRRNVRSMNEARTPSPIGRLAERR
jgi:cell division protein FtsZ